MYNDEKIDKIKLLFPPADFKIPFTEGSHILKTIEAQFISVKDLTKDLNNLRQYFNNWPDNIRHKKVIKKANLNNHNDWLNQLDSTVNYWVVITNKNSSSGKYFVYDCKPKALEPLIAVTQDDFFIIDKKYSWFSYFQVDKHINQATIFRSGERLTPFEL